MTRLGLAALAALAVLGACASSAQAATELYPDLATLAPRDLRFDQADVSYDSTGTPVHNVLRFSNTVYNKGQGPLELWGNIDPSTKRGDAFQRVYRSDGTHVDYATGAQFYYHVPHQHYHYDNWGQYQLWKAADWDAWVAGGRTGTQHPYLPGTKTSSCAIDEEMVQSPAGTPASGVYQSGGCLPDPTTGRLVEGLSVGWGDTYDYYRSQQWIDLGGTSPPYLPDDTYVLRSVTNPTAVIRETAGQGGQQDNEGIVRFQVAGGKIVDSNAPSGTVTVDRVDPETGSAHVKVQAFGRDDVSGIDQVQLSNDGSHWSAAMAYTGHPSTQPGDPSYPMQIQWDLRDYGGSSADGPHTVYVKFHDTSASPGKWSAPVSDTIQLAAYATRYSTAVLADSPAAFWRLGEGSGTRVLDYAGGNRGDYVAGPALGQGGLVPGDTGRGAVHFDGAGDFAEVPGDPSLDMASKISLEAWVKPDALPSAAGTFASIVTKDNAYSLQFNGPRLEFTLMKGQQVRHRLQAPAGAIATGQAYHVVGTYDGATQRLYVDGAEVASAPLTDSIGTNANAVRIGSWNGQGEFLAGTIQDVAVYDHALSAGAVKAHHDTGTTLRRSATSVSCGPASVGQPATCTATVSDTDGATKVTPAGSVSFSSDGAGAFSPASCALSGGGEQAACQVTYTPSAAGTETVTAGFGGDSAHDGSSGSTPVDVAPAPAGEAPAGPPTPTPSSSSPRPGPAPRPPTSREPPAGQAIDIGTAVFTAARDWSFPTGVRVRCLASAGCRVTAGASVALAAGAANHPRQVAVGSATLRLAHGRATLIRIRLATRGRQVLARARRLRVRVLVTVTAAARRPTSVLRWVTVRPPGRR